MKRDYCSICGNPSRMTIKIVYTTPPGGTTSGTSNLCTNCFNKCNDKILEFYDEQDKMCEKVANEYHYLYLPKSTFTFREWIKHMDKYLTTEYGEGYDGLPYSKGGCVEFDFIKDANRDMSAITDSWIDEDAIETMDESVKNSFYRTYVMYSTGQYEDELCNL